MKRPDLNKLFGRFRMPAQHSRQRGQGTLEYVLLMALLSGVTFAFVKVIGKDVFGGGLKELPGKASKCLSHSPNPRSECVNN